MAHQKCQSVPVTVQIKCSTFDLLPVSLSLSPFAAPQEMNEDHSTPKKEKQERLSKHKENMQHSQAEEEAHLLAQQRVYYDRNCRAFKRKVMVKRHDVEQEQIREVRRRRRTHINCTHT